MSEVLKTLGFVCVAAVVLGVAWLSRPAPPVSDMEDLQGQRLFPDFTEPLAATSMEIVEYDQALAEVRPFTVAQVDVKGEGKPRWSLPTHENYPADAQDQVADAAGSVIGLKILDVVTDKAGEHENYGVVDPDPKNRKGSAGVGTRVTMRDSHGKVLMSLIVGKEVPDRPGLRYVRKVDQDPVYIVELSTDKLSARFSDWIEKDLLKLNAWDIKQIRMRDHSVDEMNMALVQRTDTTVAYDDTAEPKWRLAKDAMFGGGKWFSVQLGPDEELDADKLDEMKDALDDLQIVDVARKPPGLSANLKVAADFGNNREAVDSLAERGFYLARIDDRVELFSNEGEVRCLMNDGVEYVLRFGEIAGVGSSAPSENADAAPASTTAGLNRFLFVMAEFNPDAIAKPERTPPPEVPPKADAETGATDAPPTDASAIDAAAGDASAIDATATDATAGEGIAADQPAADDSADQPVADPAENPADATPDEAADEQPADAKPADSSEIEAQREQIEKENRRKQDEYDADVAAGKKRVAELNARFADWYYVISDDVYEKIHLSRDQIVRKKGAAVPTDDWPGSNPADEPISPLGEFERLQQEGPGGP